MMNHAELDGCGVFWRYVNSALSAFSDSGVALCVSMDLTYCGCVSGWSCSAVRIERAYECIM